MDQHKRENRYRFADSLILNAREGDIHLQWTDPVTGERQQAIADTDELLGLKIVTENLNLDRLAHEHELPLGVFYRLLSHLDRIGILQAPPTLLRRDPNIHGQDLRDDLYTLTTFHLQWHITNACDLHCRHCYDRSKRSSMTEHQAIRALDELELFCKKHWVVGSISFTGGNPFLYPGFFELYQETSRRNFPVDILGNPVPRDQIEKLYAIHPPRQYQVSLEGRRRHNDSIRGPGNYDRVLSFLKILKAMAIPSAVMLTLTDQNLAEVLPLAHILEHRTDTFTFSRLSRTGEGAALELPSQQRFHAFLKRFNAYSEKSRIVSYKENLLSLVRYQGGQTLACGCTGYGCAIAFDGVALLPDGEVHGCRKFPSLIGNLWNQSLEDIYFSKMAVSYRRGMHACDGCPIHHVCGGCAASAQIPSSGFSDAMDPFCWRLKLHS